MGISEGIIGKDADEELPAGVIVEALRAIKNSKDFKFRFSGEKFIAAKIRIVTSMSLFAVAVPGVSSIVHSLLMCCV